MGTRLKHRGLLVTLLGVVALAVIVAVALQPLVRWATRRELNTVQGYRLDFADAHLSVIPLDYEITHFKAMADDQPKAPPIFYCDSCTIRLHWEQLLRGHLVASMRFERAKVSFVEEPSKKQPAQKAVPLGQALGKLLPLDLERVEIKDADLIYVLGADKGAPSIWVHGINATIEDLATRAHLDSGTTTLALRAEVQRSAVLNAFLTADPLAKALTFEGRASLTGLKATDLGALMKSKVDLQPTAGEIDVLALFKCKNGVLSGGVQPVVKNLQLAASQPDLGNQIKAALADIAVKVLSDRVPGRNAVSTVIPIHGDLKNPTLELWPTILGVIRNAFVEGLSESFANVPPPKAAEPESALTQAGRALSKHGGVPKAQPTEGNKTP